MSRKGLSQILYLIIAASVLMMIAMVITFTATDIIGTNKEGGYKVEYGPSEAVVDWQEKWRCTKWANEDTDNISYSDLKQVEDWYESEHEELAVETDRDPQTMRFTIYNHSVENGSVTGCKLPGYRDYLSDCELNQTGFDLSNYSVVQTKWDTCVEQERIRTRTLSSGKK
jgi:hypothetical protein